VASGSQSGKVNVWDVSNRANPVLTVLDTNAVARFVYSVAFVSALLAFWLGAVSCNCAVFFSAARVRRRGVWAG